MARERLSAPAFPALEWFEALRDAAAVDPELAVVGRWCTLELALVVGERIILLRVRDGGIAEIVSDPDIGASWDFTLRGTETDWQTFLQPIPPPFYTDFLAMNSRVQSFSIEGDRREFVRHLRAISRIFTIAQRMGAGHD
jgi:hypothetical protein